MGFYRGGFWGGGGRIKQDSPQRRRGRRVRLTLVKTKGKRLTAERLTAESAENAESVHLGLKTNSSVVSVSSVAKNDFVLTRLMLVQ